MNNQTMTTAASALVSIHDVMPSTMKQVQQCLAACWAEGLNPVYLLVVPGLDWQEEQIDTLRYWVSRGCILAGHGWIHEVSEIKGFHHRLHSLLISRNVAEHLALDANGIVRLMQDSRRWFSRQGLPCPALYVPPAWAMGSVRLDQLHATGYQYVETLRGVIDLQWRKATARALVGYEADTAFRSAMLRLWNRFNRQYGAANVTRVSIHPSDLQLRISGDLFADLGAYRAVTIEDAFVNAALNT